jgi:hypothetical protein
MNLLIIVGNDNTFKPIFLKKLLSLIKKKNINVSIDVIQTENFYIKNKKYINKFDRIFKKIYEFGFIGLSKLLFYHLTNQKITSICFDNNIKFIKSSNINIDLIKILKKKYNYIFCWQHQRINSELTSRNTFYNIHPGNLEKYPYVSPIYKAILNNEKFIELTMHKMTIDLDKGPFIKNIKIPINYNKDLIYHYLITHIKASRLIINFIKT